MSISTKRLQILSSFRARVDCSPNSAQKKNLSPGLPCTQASRQVHTKMLHKNFQLKTGELTPSGENNGKRKLAVVLPWLMAKEKHVDKYRKLYLNHGFDVLTVQVTPQQMFFPVNGSQVVAKNILDYLDTNKQYEKILVHGFSVGGYVMGEVFVKMRESQGKYRELSDRIAGVIFDSAVDVQGTPIGIARSVTKNPLAIRAIEASLKSHMALMYNVATKHYIKASKCFYDTPLKCPALLLVSEADEIATPESNMAVADSWRSKGINVSFKCWKDSRHVGHMRLHEQEYVNEVYKFLAMLDMYQGGNEKADEALRIQL